MTSLLEELGKEFQQTKAEVGEEKRKTQDLIAELEVSDTLVRFKGYCCSFIVI